MPFLCHCGFLRRRTRHALVRRAPPITARQAIHPATLAASHGTRPLVFNEFSSAVVEYSEKRLAAGRKNQGELDEPNAQ